MSVNSSMRRIFNVVYYDDVVWLGAPGVLGLSAPGGK